MLSEYEMNGQINHRMQDDLLRLSAEKDGEARDYTVYRMALLHVLGQPVF